MSQTEKELIFGQKKITLIGTAHVSKESCEEVVKAVNEKSPDCVAIELDEGRYKSLNDPESWRNLDIIKVLKNHQGFLLMANLVLSSFQRRMGQNTGVKPGDEMRAADKAAKEKGINVELVDRPIQVTLRRAWAKNSLWGKCKLLSSLFASAFDKEEVSGEEIEKLKVSSEMDSMMAGLSEYLPTVKEVLIDERDFYLASKIWNCKGENVLAVLGAGHLPGVQKHLESFAANSEKSDISEISEVPPKKIGAKIAAWIIPILIVALIAAGFYFGGRSKGSDMLGSWIFWNALLAGIGTIIAGGHPVTIIVGAVGAPVTSLCPLVGVGMLTGIVQAIVCKPKVADLETLQDDITSVKSIYKNRILRILLVFFLSSIGSSVGTFIGGAAIVKSLPDLIRKIL